MSDSEPADDSKSATDRILLITLVALGLAVAAFALPLADDSSASSRGGGGTSFDLPEGDGEPRSVEWDLPIEWVPEEGIELLIRRGEELLVTDGEGTAEGEPYQGCAVVIAEEPTPGSEVPVYVWNDGDTVSDVPVWFDGELQGRTDRNGRVVGTVNFQGELAIETSVPETDSCLFLLDGEVVGRGESTGATLALGGQQSGGWISGGSVDPAASLAVVTTATRTQADRTGNYSTSVPVDGELAVTVTGDPYPGERVDARVTVDGEEVPGATVSVDGEEQTETDDTGRATVVLPNDGSETVTVTAERGDFSGSATVEMLLAAIAIDPARAVPLPGQDAAIVVTMGERTVSDATVRKNETAIGTTGPDGTLSTALPSEPRTEFSTTVRGQTATVPTWRAYLSTAVVGFAVVFLLAGSLVAAGVGGRQYLLGVAAAWLSFFALVAGYVLGGERGLAVVAFFLAIVFLSVTLVTHRRQAAEGATDAGRRLRSVLRRTLNRIGSLLRRRTPAEWLKDVALRLAGVLARLGAAIATWFHTLGRRLRRRDIRSLLRAAAGIPRRVLDFLGRTTRRLAAGLRDGVRNVSTLLLLAGCCLVAGLTAVTYVLQGPRPAAGVALVLSVLLLAALVLAAQFGDGDAAAGTASRSGTVSRRGGTAGRQTPSVTLRRLWRTVARWVVPGRWRSRTPGEISRAAIDRGYPAEPVETLTRVFRDIEYGNHSLSDERWDAARKAFERLARHRTQEEEES